MACVCVEGKSCMDYELVEVASHMNKELNLGEEVIGI